mmetsp:Transcript_21726/g.35011  ORF Transcript_21726/g.35011 Transcript_21726/m.35011 type:complete len:177 (+) Transcript_21726:101-631(+)
MEDDPSCLTLPVVAALNDECEEARGDEEGRNETKPKEKRKKKKKKKKKKKGLSLPSALDILESATSEFITTEKDRHELNYFEKADDTGSTKTEVKSNVASESAEKASLSEIKAMQDAADLKRLAAKKRGKEVMTFKEREARKRRRGQVSRNGAGGSYVENEKRLLREMSKSDSVRL